MSAGAVLVTGASSGIGRACAERLAGNGHQVFAGVRRPEDADTLAAAGAGRIEPVLLDVTDAESIRAAVEQVSARTGGTLAGLVNNAGQSLSGPLEYVDADALRGHLDVNVVGQVAVTQACLDLLRRGRGRIVFVGSIGSRLAAPYLGPYSASKHAIAAIAESLRRELRPERIGVTLIEPGAVETRIWDDAHREVAAIEAALPPHGRRRYGKALASMRREIASAQKRAIPADRVAAAVERALTADRTRTRYLVGIDARAQAALKVLLPEKAVDAIMSARMG